LALKCRRGFLERKFPRNFIGRRSPVTWPPRSPDLTPPVLLWRYLKDAVYRAASSWRHKLLRLQLHIPAYRCVDWARIPTRYVSGWWRRLSERL
jgi:hypothetical protein